MGFTLFLIRHGETLHNQQCIIQGQLDIPLSPKGIHQAVLLSKKYSDVAFQTVWSSDLSRAWQTANLLLSSSNGDLSSGYAQYLQKPLPQLTLDKRLRERNFGVAQGHSAIELRKTAASEGKNLLTYTPEGAETADELKQRVAEFFKDLCESIDIKSVVNPIAVVGHGGWLRELSAHLSSKFPASSIDGVNRVAPNTGVSELYIELKENGELARVEYVRVHDKTHLDGIDICDEFTL